MQEGHMPVMPDEVLETLAPAPGSLQIDATVGGGGHTERILEAASPDGRVLGLDADARGHRAGRRPPRAVRRPAGPAPVELPASWPRSRRTAGFGAVDGALFDLGLSCFQLADRERGFGFRAGGPLDMRFDTTQRRPRRGAPRDPRRRRARRAVPQVRRGAGGVADREGDRRRPGHRRPSRPPRSSRRWSSGRSRSTRASAPPHPPRDARVPGAPDRGQRGARRARGRPGRRGGPAAARRPPRRPQLPLAGGPHRQAVPRRRAPGLHLPARGAGLRLRQARRASGSSPARR